MPVFEQVRERLPSLYRPGDDSAGEPIPLRAADVLEINGAPPPAGSLSEAAGSVRVRLEGDARVEAVRIAPAAVVGSLVNLELYRMSGATPLPLPGAVARVNRGLATFADLFEARRFTLRLRRPDLLTLLIWAAARVLERTGVEAAEVMQAHWFEYADQARYDGFFNRAREQKGLGPAAADDVALLLFPYIRDLSRIGALLALLPWREPAAHRETVEAYRQRLRRTVRLYRNGLGTMSALRGITEVQLPLDLAAPAGLRDRPFTVEEYARVVVSTAAAQSRGAPTGLVGPLMRWSLHADGHFPATPTVIVEGQEPVADGVDATARPALELFSEGGARRRLAIAYDGTVAPGQALRLRPAFSCWVAGAGLRVSTSVPAAALPADPTAAGGWTAAAGAPAGRIRLLLQTRDRALWAAVGEEGGATALWRYDGQGWTEALDALPAVHCLAEDGADLLLGTDEGALRVGPYPAPGAPFAAAPAAAGGEMPVRAILRAADGTLYLGTEEGLAIPGADGSLEPFVLGAAAETTVAVHALHQDLTGSLHIGTDLGLFRYQPGLGHWYWYRGEEQSEQRLDWVRFRPEAAAAERAFPAPEQVFIPPVRCVHRGPDASLWIGTDRGIARYVALPVEGLSFLTLLEAFPDLATGPVRQIREDERGLLWFATEQGLFRFDGRDWWQLRGGSLARLPTPEAGEPRPWRFQRGLDRWEWFDGRRALWRAFEGEPRATAEARVDAVTWTDGVAADLGAWDGTAFTPDGGAAPAPLRMRYKPEETRIVDGGIPAVPRVPPGDSVWRYLALEPDPVLVPASAPAWTCEGRLLPPPADRAPVLEGRYGAAAPLDLSQFDDAAFAFNPAARVWIGWGARHPLAVLVRLRTTTPGERLDPAVLDRVWSGIQQVRPAGVRALLAVDEEVVRGSA